MAQVGPNTSINAESTAGMELVGGDHNEVEATGNGTFNIGETPSHAPTDPDGCADSMDLTCTEEGCGTVDSPTAEEGVGKDPTSNEPFASIAQRHKEEEGCGTADEVGVVNNPTSTEHKEGCGPAEVGMVECDNKEKGCDSVDNSAADEVVGVAMCEVNAEPDEDKAAPVEPKVTRRMTRVSGCGQIRKWAWVFLDWFLALNTWL